MAIYDVNGNSIALAYGLDNTLLGIIYDVNGDIVFSPNTIKVMEYNVGQYHIGSGSLMPASEKETYADLQTTIFNNHNPDICLMQEATTNFCADGTIADDFLSTWFDTFRTSRGSIPYQGHKVATNGYSIVDYTDVPFINAVGNYPAYETFYITLNGKSVFFVNTHMSTNQTYQVAQCMEVLDAVSDKEYFVICGDFNTVITSALNEEDYTDCIKPFLDAGYADANCGKFGVFPNYYATSDPNASYKPATDHIIVSSNIKIVNAYVDTTKLTDDIDDKIDHVPLIAELVVL